MAKHEHHLSSSSDFRNFATKDIGVDTNSIFENKPEAIVWNNFKAGCDKSFLFIYRKYVNVLFNYGTQFTADHELVKDCIQDLFIMLKNKRQKLADVKFIKSYLFKSLRNDLIRVVRRNENQISFDKYNEQGFAIAIAHEAKLIDEELFIEKRASLEKALNCLQARQREAIVLYYYEGLSYEEIAMVLDLKLTKSARKLIYRALVKMKESTANGSNQGSPIS